MNLLMRLCSTKVCFPLIVVVGGTYLYAVYLRKVEVLSNYNMNGELNQGKLFVPRRMETKERLHSRKTDRLQTNSKSLFGELRSQNDSSMLFVPLGTELLHSQAAGGRQNNKFLQYKDGTIFKRMQGPPRGPREINFYKTVFGPENTKEDIRALREFVPCFMGEYHLEDDPKVIYVKLDNVIARYHKPCVMDVKIGKVTYDPEATPEMILKAKRKSTHHIRETVGFRILGMQVYNPSLDKTVYYNSSFLKSRVNPSKGLEFFFTVKGKLRRDIIEVVLKKARAIEKWFLTQRTFSFYSSSLLVAFDADVDQPSTGACNTESIERLRCVDSSTIDNIVPPDFGQFTSLEISKFAGGSKRNSPIKISNDNLVKKDSRRSSYEPSDANTAINPMFEDMLTKQKNRTCKYVKADVRMIDFAHAFYTKFRDDNYLFGLSNFIRYLEEIIK